MTLDRAREILKEQHDLELVDIYERAGDLYPVEWRVVRVFPLEVVSRARSWGEAFARATGEAPI